MTRNNSISHILVGALVAATALAAGARFARAQPLVDPSYYPGNKEKQRFVRAGASIGDLRAEAMQFMDFGFEILDGIMKRDSIEPVYTTLYWATEFEKWNRRWTLIMDELDGVLKKKNMESAQQTAWREKYDTFFTRLGVDGMAVMTWKREVYERKFVLDMDIDNFPYRVKRIEEALEEAEKLLTEADRVAAGSATASEIAKQIENTKQAYNLARAASIVLLKLKEEVEDAHGNRKATLDSKIVKIANSWDKMHDDYPDLMKRWTDRVKAWARAPKKAWDDYLAARKKRDELYAGILKKGRFDKYAHFKGVAYDNLETAATKVQRKLEAKR